MRLTPTILYVEDDADTRELISILLKMENYQVVVAENFEEALLLARIVRFDLYIMDNWMPGGSGIELCKRLRERDATTPIIFYSGAAYDSDKREAFACGAQAYLTKPTDNDTLIVTIAHVLAAAAKRNVPARTVTLDSVGHKPLGASGLQ
jgi:DNA-binding response OmpR family regulator